MMDCNADHLLGAGRVVEPAQQQPCMAASHGHDFIDDPTLHQAR